MNLIATIKTNRLELRNWKKEDLIDFARLNADPRVMEFFFKTLNRLESDELAKKIQAHLKEKGWGFWAVSLLEEDKFIGFIGLQIVHFLAPFTPSVEIGWRLAFDYWNKGYATEGAKACLEYGFNTLNLNEIVSFTTVNNLRSVNVMKRLHMHHHKEDDFDHPNLPKKHPLQRQVLYRIKKKEWENSNNSLKL